MDKIALLLDQLETKLKAAKRLPRGILPIVEQMRAALGDVAQAKEKLARERERLTAQAREEAERIVAQAHEQAQRQTAEQEIVLEAKESADEMREEAAAEAESVRKGADDYAFEVLCQLEQELNRTLTVLANGLRTLQEKRDGAARGDAASSADQETGADEESPPS